MKSTVEGTIWYHYYCYNSYYYYYYVYSVGGKRLGWISTGEV